MRISDWSSDVCSSDLRRRDRLGAVRMSAALADRQKVVNFGCRLNIAEGETIRSAVEAAGAQGTIVFNSCAVTDEAVRPTRQAVRRALRERPGAEGDRKCGVSGKRGAVSVDIGGGR